MHTGARANGCNFPTKSPGAGSIVAPIVAGVSIQYARATLRAVIKPAKIGYVQACGCASDVVGPNPHTCIAQVGRGAYRLQGGKVPTCSKKRDDGMKPIGPQHGP